MGYVLVPVPTEFVLDVMRWVLFRAADSDPDALPDDIARLQRFLVETDDETRAFLRRIAAATAKNENLRLLDLADEMEQTPAAIQATAERLNREVLDGDRELLELRNDVHIWATGRVGKMTFIAMRPALARVVRASASTADA